MTVKTITITEQAYERLKALKQPSESFSEMFFRITNRRPLSDFYGVLGKESGERLEKTMLEMRKKRKEAHAKRMKKIVAALNEA